MTSPAMTPDAHLDGWPPPSLRDPLRPPDPTPEPSGWHRRGGKPDQPDPSLPSVFELHATARGGTDKTARKQKPGSVVRKRRRRR